VIEYDYNMLHCVGTRIWQQSRRKQKNSSWRKDRDL